MPDKRNPAKKRLGFFDARDRIFHLNAAYRAQAFGGPGLDAQSRRFQRELAEVDTPEPAEDLEDAELGEAEHRQAMERERLRRDRAE